MLDHVENTVKMVQFLATDPASRARTGQSPHTIILRNHASCVRYFPAEAATQRPVFISMPPINTWTIWDLLPGRSIVEKLTQAGHPVYLLDWGRPTIADGEVTLEDWVDRILHRSIVRSQRHMKQKGFDAGFDAIGYCLGGSLLSIALSRHETLARSMALVAAPIDFHASGRLSIWASHETFPVDDVVNGLTNFPPELMRMSFAWLRPWGQIQKWDKLKDRMGDEGFLEVWAAMEQWNNDSVRFPGEAYREYIERCYFNNSLLEGGWMLGDKPVDLKQGTCPAIAIAGDGDHICETAGSHGLAKAWGGPVETEVVKGGHVGISIGSRLPKALLQWLESQA